MLLTLMSLVDMFTPDTPPVPIVIPSIGGGPGGGGGKSTRQMEAEKRFKELQIEDDTILEIVKIMIQCL